MRTLLTPVAFVMALTVGSSAQVRRDIDGARHDPLRPPAGGLALLFFVLPDCPISNRYAPEIRRICEIYGRRGVACSLVYADPTLTDAGARAHARDYAHGPYPRFVDHDRTLVRATGATVAPEAVVIDASGTVAYRGRIDDRYAELGQARRVVRDYTLRDVLDALLDGRPVAHPRLPSIGCYLERIAAADR
jgi:hypothetical protein